MTKENELGQAITPVIKLGGMLQMLDWVDALAAYQQSGNIGSFAPLLEAAGQNEMGQCLRKAAFFENTNQISEAQAPTKAFHQSLNHNHDPLIELFKNQLKERTVWVNEDYYAQRQQTMAEHHLKQGDYLRATILIQEALITRLLQKKGSQKKGSNDILKYSNRQNEKESLENEIKRHKKNKTIKPTHKAYKQLQCIRNALAHGTRATGGEAQAALASEESLRKTLQEILIEIKKI